MNQIPCPLIEAARSYGDRTAIISADRTLSYSQLNRYVGELAQYFEEIGLRPNQRVAIIDTNHPEYPVILLALWRMRAVGCPLSYRFPETTLVELLRNMNCLFVISSYKQILDSKMIRLRKIRFEDVVHFDDGKKKGFSKKSAKISLGQEATIIHTSGTGGIPKAALHTYANHYFNALGANRNMPLQAGDRWLLALPLYHVGGLGILFRVLLGQAAIVVPKKDEGLTTSIHQYKVTHLSLVATQLYRILQNKSNRKKLSTLKAILVGGGPISSFLVEKSLQWDLPIYLTYGLTEMASQVATSTQPISEPLRAMVRVLKYREVKISQNGEIWVKGRTLLKGYVDNGRIFLPLKKNGWFATGDLGAIDRGGRLSVVGRTDNMFISGGENIHPEEIEKKLFEFPQIEKAVVVPVADQEFGFRTAVFLKTEKGQEFDLNSLRSHLEKHLSRFKIPIHFYQWPDLTKPRNLKENRRYFRALVQEKKGILKKIL